MAERVGSRLSSIGALGLLLLVACGGNAAPLDSDGGAPIEVDSTPPATPYPKPAGNGGSVEEGLARLNAYRLAAGVGAVSLDPNTSAACLGHLQYLATEAGPGVCLLDHDEGNHDNPYYSPTNEQAGQGALIACVPTGEGGLHSARSVDRWVGSLYHRIPLLSPGLVSIGLAEHSGYVCLHHVQGTAALADVSLVVWPAAGMVDVPQEFPGRESPCPTMPSDPKGIPADQCPSSGFIVTATWFGPPGSGSLTQMAVSAAVLETGAGVDLLALYGDGIGGNDPVPKAIPRTVALVPASALPALMHVQVDAQVVVDGVQRQALWQFALGSRKE